VYGAGLGVVDADRDAPPELADVVEAGLDPAPAPAPLAAAPLRLATGFFWLASPRSGVVCAEPDEPAPPFSCKRRANKRKSRHRSWAKLQAQCWEAVARSHNRAKRPFRALSERKSKAVEPETQTFVSSAGSSGLNRGRKAAGQHCRIRQAQNEAKRATLSPAPRVPARQRVSVSHPRTSWVFQRLARPDPCCRARYAGERPPTPGNRQVDQAPHLAEALSHSYGDARAVRKYRGMARLSLPIRVLFCLATAQQKQQSQRVCRTRAVGDLHS
jgi:hypothetical protein